MSCADGIGYSFTMSSRRLSSWVALSLIGALLLLIGALAGRSLLFPQYEAEAVLELTGMHGKTRADMSRILDENRNLMKSPEFLGAVVDRLEMTRFRGISREQAIKALGKEVSVGGIGGTDLLSIRASHRQKEEALMVAREILAEFVMIKEAISLADLDEERKKLTDEVSDQERKIDEARSRNVIGNGNHAEELAREEAVLEGIRMQYLSRPRKRGYFFGPVVVHEDPEMHESP